MTSCVNCRKRPQGPPLVGVTPRGAVFVSRACVSCQAQVDRVIAEYTTIRQGPKR